MKKLAIIPARGGSKRIPRKNIKPFLGKPIIAYSIEVALASGLFDEVMVSTDDIEISNIAREYGANVPFIRSQQNSGDFATTSDVILEVLEQYSRQGTCFKYACCIYPTAPLIQVESLKGGFEKLRVCNYATVFPVVQFSYSIWRALKIDSADMVKMVWPENLNKRSQDLESAYHDAGQWYWINVDKFSEKPSLYSMNSSCLVLEESKVQDIDNMTDWKLAELKYELL